MQAAAMQSSNRPLAVSAGHPSLPALRALSLTSTTAVAAGSSSPTAITAIAQEQMCGEVLM